MSNTRHSQPEALPNKPRTSEKHDEEITLAGAYLNLAKLSWEFANFLMIKLLYNILKGTWKLVAPPDHSKTRDRR